MAEFLANLHPLHLLVQIFFGALIVCLFLQVILSWLTLVFIPPGHPIVLFFNRLTSPMIDPLRKRIPTMSLGMLDLGGTIAFLFAWWAIAMVGALVDGAIPAAW